MRILLLLVIALVSISTVTAFVLTENLRSDIAAFTKVWSDPRIKASAEDSSRLLDQVFSASNGSSFECGVCAIAINEVEGFLAFNNTEQEIEQYLDALCVALPPGVQGICEDIVSQLPSIIGQIENTDSVATICIELGYCTPDFFPNSTDPVPMPVHTIDLDDAPIDRWTEICSISQYQQSAQLIYNTVVSYLPNGGKIIEELGELVNDNYFPYELGLEIKGCAKVIGIPYGWLAWLNLGYEVTETCTSIVVEKENGQIILARNHDFGVGMGFTAALKNLAVQVDFQKGGVTQYSTVGYAGFVGSLSGFKSKAFSITINTRFYPDGISELFYEVIAAILEKNASLVSFLPRQILQNDATYTQALYDLENTELIADVYYTIAGTQSGEGTVVSRNRTVSADNWVLQAPTRWFEVQSNYDHWTPMPWYDDRVDPANAVIANFGQKGISLDKMMQVISTKPVLNIQTVHSILACPATGEFSAWLRYCQYPCVQ